MTMHRICALSELVDGAAANFEVGRNTVAVVRIGERVYAIGNRCSHADIALSDGEVDCDTKELECPRHGSAFSGAVERGWIYGRGTADMKGSIASLLLALQSLRATGARRLVAPWAVS